MQRLILLPSTLIKKLLINNAIIIREKNS